MNFEIEKLNYNYGDLEPYIDSETMKVHYEGHYKSYFDKLNKILKENNLKYESLEHIIRNLDSLVPSNILNEVKNQGGGAYNHTFFFKSLTPYSIKIAKGSLLKEIEKEYENFNNFKELFKIKSLSNFGSGWTWLILENNKLSIESTQNQDCPISHKGKEIIIGLDLWEHAYYLKHKNLKANYIDNYWNVLDWETISNNFEKIKGR